MTDAAYKVFVTNQNRLAELVNITPQHLSGIKSGSRSASKEVICKLMSITGIISPLWATNTEKPLLKKALRKFFINQKEKETLYLQGRRATYDPSTSD